MRTSGPTPTGTACRSTRRFEILADDVQPVSGLSRGLHGVNIESSDDQRDRPLPPPINPSLADLYNNPSWHDGTTTQPRPARPSATGTSRFILDGRWLHAFNGPGMTTNAVYAQLPVQRSPSIAERPQRAGMDEDYDAVDLENWFLAMQSADGSGDDPVVPPAGGDPDRPRRSRRRSTTGAGPRTQPTAPDLDRLGLADPPPPRRRRPRCVDVPRPRSRPDRQDHLRRGQRRRRPDRLGLGRPGLSGPPQRAGPALQAALRVHGHRPQRPDPAEHGRATWPARRPESRSPGTPRYTYGGGAAHAAHLGNSVSEVDPTYALQNGYDPNFDDARGLQLSPREHRRCNTQVDNAGIDVRLTQLRNLLAGTRPPQKTTFGTGTDGDTNYVSVETASGSGVPSKLFMPNGVADPFDTFFGTDANGFPVRPALDAAGCRPVGRGRLDTGRNLRLAVVSQSAGDQQLREPGPRQLLQLGPGGLFVRYRSTS